MLQIFIAAYCTSGILLITWLHAAQHLFLQYCRGLHDFNLSRCSQVLALEYLSQSEIQSLIVEQTFCLNAKQGPLETKKPSFIFIIITL